MADCEKQFLFTKEELDKTPTILQGWPKEKELYNRQLCATMIQDIGVKLKLYPLR